MSVLVTRTLYWLKRLAPVLLIAAGIAIALAFHLQRYVSLHELTLRRDWLEHGVQAHPAAAFFGFAAAYAVYVTICLPGLSLLNALAGFLFGLVQGGAIAIAGDTLGAVLVFLASRSAFGNLLRSRAGPTAARIEAGISAHGMPYLLAMRLMPASPFWLVNIAAGLLSIRLRTYALATAIGIAPVCLLYAQLGARARVVVDRGVKVDASFFSQPQVLAPLLALGLLSAAPITLILVRAAQARRRARADLAPPA